MKTDDDLIITQRGNMRRLKPIKYFVDKNHKIMSDYYDFLESAEGRLMAIDVIKQMEKFIKIDENFLDPYNEIANMASEAGDEKTEDPYRHLAYLKAIHIVANKDGVYPNEMYWGHMENRHIIRALDNYAYYIWGCGRDRIALEIYRKLLRSNLNDNIGARFNILAIRMGLNPDYENKFIPKKPPVFGLDALKIGEWFDKNSVKFSEEFAEYNLFLAKENPDGWD